MEMHLRKIFYLNMNCKKKKIYRVKEESNAATIYVSEEIKKYKYIEENMHFKYSYRICIILRIFFRK